jgi:hypothetical protein
MAGREGDVSYLYSRASAAASLQAMGTLAAPGRRAREGQEAGPLPGTMRIKTTGGRVRQTQTQSIPNVSRLRIGGPWR